MLHIDASIHRICAFADEKGWGAEKYGQVAGIPASTARDVLKQRGNPTQNTIRAMEAVIPRSFRAPRRATHVAPSHEARA